MAALDDSEIEAALAALRVLSAKFRSSGHDAAASLFDAIADAIRSAASAQSGHSLP